MQPSQPSGSAGGANASSSGMTGGGVQSAAFPEIARAAALSAPAVSFPFGPVPLQQGPSRLPAHGSPGSLAAVPELPQAGVSMRFPWGGSVEALTLSAAAAAAPVAARGLLPPLPSAMSLGSLGGPLPRFMDGLDGQGAFPWMGLSRSVGGSVAYGAPSPSAWPPAMRQAPFVAPGGTASAPQLWPVVVAPTHQTDQMNQNLTEGKVASRKRNVDGTAASRTALPNGDGGGNSSTGVSADGFLDRPAAAAAPAPKREIKTCTKGHVYVVPLADCRSPSDDERSRLAEKISTDEPPHQKRKLCDSNEEEGESKARVGGTGSSSDASVECPYCSGKLFSVERCLADTHPDVAAEWHYVRNDGLCSAAGTPLTPYTILPGCNRKNRVAS